VNIENNFERRRQANYYRGFEFTEVNKVDYTLRFVARLIHFSFSLLMFSLFQNEGNDFLWVFYRRQINDVIPAAKVLTNQGVYLHSRKDELVQIENKLSIFIIVFMWSCHFATSESDPPN